MILWAYNLNKSSNRWHAYKDGKALCGTPLRPVLEGAQKKFPGRHVSCRKCEAVAFAKPEKVTVAQCSIISMVAGGEEKRSEVIDGEKVMQWVGIGWIEVRKATPEDLRTLPRVDRGEG